MPERRKKQDKTDNRIIDRKKKCHVPEGYVTIFSLRQ